VHTSKSPQYSTMDAESSSMYSQASWSQFGGRS
jgi:hypothetical protein